VRETTWVRVVQPAALVLAAVVAAAVYRRGGEINHMLAAFALLVLTLAVAIDGLRWLIRRNRQTAQPERVWLWPERVWVWIVRPTLVLAPVVAVVAAVKLNRYGTQGGQILAAFIVVVLAYVMLAFGLRWLFQRTR
jgi:hypothetical protein